MFFCSQWEIHYSTWGFVVWIVCLFFGVSLSKPKKTEYQIRWTLSPFFPIPTAMQHGCQVVHSTDCQEKSQDVPSFTGEHPDLWMVISPPKHHIQNIYPNDIPIFLGWILIFPN